MVVPIPCFAVSASLGPSRGRSGVTGPYARQGRTWGGQRLDRGECGAAGPDRGSRSAKPRILFQKARDKAGQEGRPAYLPPTGLRGKCGHTEAVCPPPGRRPVWRAGFAHLPVGWAGAGLSASSLGRNVARPRACG